MVVEEEIDLVKTEMKVSIHEESEDGRLTRRTRRMKGGESVRELWLAMIY